MIHDTVKLMYKTEIFRLKEMKVAGHLSKMAAKQDISLLMVDSLSQVISLVVRIFYRFLPIKLSVYLRR